jgi:hypothetical protein
LPERGGLHRLLRELPAQTAASAGTLCHASAGPCDVSEFCDGSSPMCPSGQFAAAGTPCNGPCPTSCTGSSATCPASNSCSQGNVACSTPPDPADLYAGSINLYTGCGVFNAGLLVYSDYMANLSGPTLGGTSGPTPWVAGKGWTLTIDESIEPVSAGYIRHTVAGDIPYTTFVSTLGGFISSPPDGASLLVVYDLGNGPQLKLVGLDMSAQFYGGDGSPNYQLSGRQYLSRIETYGGVDNPAPPLITASVDITRNTFAQTTAIQDSFGNSLYLAYSEPGNDLTNIASYTTRGFVGTTAVGGWDDNHRIQQLLLPGNNAGSTITLSFTYEGNGLLASTTDPTGAVSTIDRNETAGGLYYGRITRVRNGAAADQNLASLGSIGLDYNTCGNTPTYPNPTISTRIRSSYGEETEYTMDTSIRRVVTAVDPIGNTGSYQWYPNGQLQSALELTTNPTPGAQYTYNAVTGSLMSVTRSPDQQVVYRVNLLQGQAQAADAPAGFLPTAWTDQTGIAYQASYDSLNRVSSTRDDTNTYSVTRAAHTLGVVDGVVDEIYAVNGVAQSADTLDGTGAVVAAYEGAPSAQTQVETILRNGADRLPRQINVAPSVQVSLSNPTVLGAPQNIATNMGAKNLQSLVASYTGWGQPSSINDSVTTVSSVAANSGEPLSAALTTGGVNQSSAIGYKPGGGAVPASASAGQANPTFPVQTWSNPAVPLATIPSATCNGVPQ